MKVIGECRKSDWQRSKTREAKIQEGDKEKAVLWDEGLKRRE